MSRKSILFIVIGVVVALLAFMGYKVVRLAQQKQAVEQALQKVPDFEFLSTNGEKFTQASIDVNTPTLFVFFNSECDFCRYEAQDISENIEELKDIEILFISTESTIEITSFSEEFNLNQQQNIHFLHDSTSALYNLFDLTSYPSILIYNKNKNLLKRHKGQLNVQAILRVLKEND